MKSRFVRNAEEEELYVRREKYPSLTFLSVPTNAVGTLMLIIMMLLLIKQHSLTNTFKLI